MVPHVVWSPGAGLVLELGEIALPAAHPADVTVPEGFDQLEIADVLSEGGFGDVDAPPPRTVSVAEELRRALRDLPPPRQPVR